VQGPMSRAHETMHPEAADAPGSRVALSSGC
jgi:hypothetical protein